MKRFIGNKVNELSKGQVPKVAQYITMSRDCQVCQEAMSVLNAAKLLSYLVSVNCTVFPFFPLCLFPFPFLFPFASLLDPP
jgi:hypothetical protein